MSERAALWLFHFFCSTAESIINARACLRHLSNKSLEDGLYSYCDVVDYLLGMYATEDVNAEAVQNIWNCTQQPSTTSVLYAQTLWDKLLRCSTVYDEETLKGSTSEDFPSQPDGRCRIIGPQTNHRQWKNLSDMPTCFALSKQKGAGPPTVSVRRRTFNPNRGQNQDATSALQLM